MARISLASHWKFRRLCRAIAAIAPPPDQLVGPSVIAQGILEHMWAAGYASISAHVGTPEELAELVHWRGDPVVLATLLVDAGFLDHPAPGEYVIHDLWDHAPRYAQLRHQRQLSEKLCQTNDARPLNVGPSVGNFRTVQARQGKASPGSKGSAAVASPSPDGETKDETPDPKKLVPLGYELVRQGQQFTTDADVKDAIAYLAARYGIAYDGASIAAALDALKHAKAPLFSRG